MKRRNFLIGFSGVVFSNISMLFAKPKGNKAKLIVEKVVTEELPSSRVFRVIPSEVCPTIKILDDPFLNAKRTYHLSIKYKGAWFHLQDGLEGKGCFQRSDIDEHYTVDEFMNLLWQEDNEVA